jgi:hypothetical protein
MLRSLPRPGLRGEGMRLGEIKVPVGAGDLS